MNASPCLLAVFAHPDDEAFRCGGMLARLAQRGVRVQVLTVTRGEAGACGDPPLCRPEELGAVREAELHCACRALGIEPPRLLDYPDGTLRQVNEDDPVGRIMAIIHQVHPQVLLTWHSAGISGHPDHIAVSRWAMLAFERAMVLGRDAPSALYQMVIPQSVARAMGLAQLRPVPDEQVTLAVDVSPVWEKKMAAIHCHHTQMGESPILTAPLERQRLFLGMEHFMRVASCGEGDFFGTS
ncbi:MAG: PIG-L family deacetylase [Chloroflexota bacterium]|nr:PIG-L family deacetylase [Chloroflexota bacterium]